MDRRSFAVAVTIGSAAALIGARPASAAPPPDPLFMAQRMNAKTIELDASHLSIVSKAREVANLIIEAAGG